MKIKQLSIFLENKTGRINEVTKILSHAGINMQAFSMAETTDFGILRLIVAEVDKAVEVLREANFAVMLTDVVCIKCRNEAGALARALNILGSHGFNMRTLRSRPMKELLWQYYFYVEAEGDINGYEGRCMLEELAVCCDRIKAVGSFVLQPGI